MASAGRADASTYCRNKCVVQRVTLGQSHIHLQVTGKYEQVSATRLSPAGIASYEASRWLIVQIARRAVEKCFHIFTAWMTRLWLIMLYLICSIQPPSAGWFNGATSWRHQGFTVAGIFFLSPPLILIIYFWICLPVQQCVSVIMGVGMQLRRRLYCDPASLCVSAIITFAKITFFLVLQIGMCLHMYFS